MYYTYVLQSAEDDGFYVEFTKDLMLRPTRLNNAPHKNLILWNEILLNWIKAAC